MRFRVDTHELWSMAAIAQECADGLGEASLALGSAAEVGSWCTHAEAVVATVAAVGALEEQLRSTRVCAAGLARQLGSAANAYEDVDTLRPR